MIAATYSTSNRCHHCERARRDRHPPSSPHGDRADCTPEKNEFPLGFSAPKRVHTTPSTTWSTNDDSPLDRRAARGTAPNVPDRLWVLWDQHFPRRPHARHPALPRKSPRLSPAGSRLRWPAESDQGAARRLRRAPSKIKVGRGAEVRLMPGTVLIREWDAASTASPSRPMACTNSMASATRACPPPPRRSPARTGRVRRSSD
jgi:hypothetical protein